MAKQPEQVSTHIKLPKIPQVMLWKYLHGHHSSVRFSLVIYEDDGQGDNLKIMHKSLENAFLCLQCF